MPCDTGADVFWQLSALPSHCRAGLLDLGSACRKSISELLKERDFAMADAPIQVKYADAPSPAWHFVVTSSFDFEQTLERLKQGIAAHDLWLIHEIDPQMLLKRGGLEIHKTRQLLFFHPRYMQRLLEANPNALIEAPLKIVVMQSSGGDISVRTTDIEKQLGRYAGLETLAKELSEIARSIVASVTTTAS